MSEETIFTRIIKGEVPSHKVYEDECTYAFMDINPIQRGHVLVVSKTPTETFEAMDDEDYQALMATVKKVAEKIKQVLRPKRVGVIIEGFEVNHAHVKVLPINSETELRHLPGPDEKPTDAELAEMAEKLKIDTDA